VSTRRRWAFAGVVALSSGGCALVAGYDFGKYSESGGTGGAGGRGASSVSSGPSSSGGFTTGTMTVSSSSSSSMTTSASSSSGMTSSSSSSSGFGGSNGVTVLADGLVDPVAVAVDTGNVYFTTNTVTSSTACYFSKSAPAPTTPLSLVKGAFGAPAVVSQGSGAYAAVTTDTNSLMGNVDVLGTGTVVTLSSVANVTMQGIAVWGSTVYFTTTSANVSIVPPGGQPQSFVANQTAQGPITADGQGVYWPTIENEMVYAPLGVGSSATPLCTGLPAPVNAVTTDATYVYWTDQSGGVYRVTKNTAGSRQSLNALPDNTAAYGIAVDGAGSVYFAQGADVLRVTFTSNQPIVVAPKVGAPRGLVLDGTDLYVADMGAAGMPGRILRISLQ
jgi:hypothetical protein